MDRTVIVLTPQEWESRSSLGEAARRAYQHCHYIKDAQLAIKSISWLIADDLDLDSRPDIVEKFDKIAKICDQISADARKAQLGIGDVATLIEYDIKSGEKVGTDVRTLSTAD